MKYYDGMGKDVSNYVLGLEQTILELKAKIKATAEVSVKTEDSTIGIVEEETKPIRRRKIKLADTQ